MTEQTPLIDCDGNEIAIGSRVGVWPADRAGDGTIAVGTAVGLNYLNNAVEVLFLGGHREIVPVAHMMIVNVSPTDAELPKPIRQAVDALAGQIVGQVKPGGDLAEYATGGGMASAVAMRLRERVQRDLYEAQAEAES